ncbi:hypothetical protein HPP92_013007 [Vanilla planifolia]|uniref:Uncharacterized protein n=1 Tax=Vanilla planifolia TaxID=51239 RepID=A0A835QUU5_VANPL|nr:hypothetical protein HPP92_013007 [Vanilla planifolia]
MALHLHKLLRKSPPSFLTLASLNKIEFSQFFIPNPSLSSFPALLPNPSSSPQLSCFQEHNARVDAISSLLPFFSPLFFIYIRLALQCLSSSMKSQTLQKMAAGRRYGLIV